MEFSDQSTFSPWPCNEVPFCVQSVGVLAGVMLVIL